MARRKHVEAQRPDRTKVKAPAWLFSTYAGLRHVAGIPDSAPITTPVMLSNRPRLDEARRAWCQENGCYRQGKSCVEVFGVRCDNKPVRPAPTRGDDNAR